MKATTISARRTARVMSVIAVNSAVRFGALWDSPGMYDFFNPDKQ